jgi:two-component system alkaline phosphatase synthesis response regulator PhoP
MPIILAVDDELNILELVKLYLGREGYQVETASSGGEALSKLKSLTPELIVLDVMLPDIDGFEVCRQVRTASHVPILMLTARREDVDKVAGLELGADDYLTKPFNPRELVARIKAILRRSQATESPENSSGKITMAKLCIDLPRHEVSVDGRELKLRTKEFDMLSTLAKNQGILLSREKLLEIVWGFDYFGETRTVDVHINHLREKLAQSGVTIETIRGSGYKLMVSDSSK